ncbi:MAG: ATP-binding protein [Bacteroidales bacterium]|nr:ATP-binding protein [Bacteroidales bacterium]
MQKEDFIRILSDQKAEIEAININKYCARREEEQFDFDSTLAQIVIGVRRCGKSTLCIKVLKQKNINFIYVNFDDERLSSLTKDDLNVLLEAAYIVYGDTDYMFFDEIQNVPQWHLFINRLLRQNLHLFITGSNAKLLSGELSTYLTGRYNEIVLFPFSFAEYCSVKHIDTEQKTTKSAALLTKALAEYLADGGLPETVNVKNKRKYVMSLLNSIIKKDISQRFKIRYTEALNNMANHLINNFSQEVVINKLKDIFSFGSSHTAENYYSHLKEAYLLLGLKKFSFKSRERIYNEKAYVVDLSFVSQRTDNFSAENWGWRLENAVYVELLRRCNPLSLDIFYAKDGYEIDFLVTQAGHTEQLIQVCWSLSSKKTYNREVNALVKGAEKYHCEDLLLITMNDASVVEIGGHKIKIVNAEWWFLEDKV